MEFIIILSDGRIDAYERIDALIQRHVHRRAQCVVYAVLNAIFVCAEWLCTR